ncbi:hypothetical protein C8R45DRAFT_1104354 [Mycena sanguinolenta]|nr:hypothetical protein C8R45DRAFT_1104354 [Mycena sanguinolenta]
MRRPSTSVLQLLSHFSASDIYSAASSGGNHPRNPERPSRHISDISPTPPHLVYAKLDIPRARRPGSALPSDTVDPRSSFPCGTSRRGELAGDDDRRPADEAIRTKSEEKLVMNAGNAARPGEGVESSRVASVGVWSGGYGHLDAQLRFQGDGESGAQGHREKRRHRRKARSPIFRDILPLFIALPPSFARWRTRAGLLHRYAIGLHKFRVK